MVTKPSQKTQRKACKVLHLPLYITTDCIFQSKPFSFPRPQMSQNLVHLPFNISQGCARLLFLQQASNSFLCLSELYLRSHVFLCTLVCVTNNCYNFSNSNSLISWNRCASVLLPPHSMLNLTSLLEATGVMVCRTQEWDPDGRHWWWRRSLSGSEVLIIVVVPGSDYLCQEAVNSSLVVCLWSSESQVVYY